MHRKAFTLIELLVVIAIIAILAVVVVLTLNPAQLLAESRDANRVSDMATITSAMNLYTTDQAGASSFSLGTTTNTYISVYDPNASSTCGSLGMLYLSSGTWACSTKTNYRIASSTGWLPVNLQNISSGSPIGSLPVDPINQTSTGLFYAYNTNGIQFQVTADFESSKYKSSYATNVQTSMYPEIISAGTPGISALYNPTGLIGYWPMNEGSGSSTIDQSGSGNNGTWNGTPVGSNSTYYIGGKVGAYAGTFNGGNDYVNIPSSAYAFTGPFSISLWMNENTTSSAEMILSAQSGGASTGYFLSVYPTVIDPQIAISGSSFQNVSGPPVLFGTWEMVTMTYDGASLTLYVNGSFYRAASSTAPYLTSGALVMGETQRGGFSNYSGSLDEVRAYNRALSPAEVAALYDAEK